MMMSPRRDARGRQNDSVLPKKSLVQGSNKFLLKVYASEPAELGAHTVMR